MQIRRGVLRSMLAWAGERHPNEIVLLLRGHVDNDVARIDEFLFPPHASGGRGFTQFPAHMLPIDFSIIGTAHSHPAGSHRPSPTDLNKFYGKVMMILAYPYREDCVGVYDRQEEPLGVELIV